MLPEISRRCNSCGASIREAAMFCPECGKAVSRPGAETESPADKPAERDAADGKVTSQPLSVALIGESVKSKPSEPVADAEQLKPKTDAPPASKTGKYERARESLHRASSATREALADNVKRVEKIRQVSSTMIEEAAYDPSLRFVLVALAIFVVFIILLVLSKVMG